MRQRATSSNLLRPLGLNNLRAHHAIYINWIDSPPPKRKVPGSNPGMAICVTRSYRHGEGAWYGCMAAVMVWGGQPTAHNLGKVTEPG